MKQFIFAVLFLHLISLSHQQPKMLECGVRQVDPPQVTLREGQTYLGQWPWAVAIYHLKLDDSFEYACAGTLISSQHVITTYSCLVDPRGFNTYPEKVFVQLRPYKLEATNVVQIRRQEESLYTILTLGSNVRFDDYLQPACIYQHHDVTAGTFLSWRSQEDRTRWVPLTSYAVNFSRVSCENETNAWIGARRELRCAELSFENICNLDKGGNLYTERSGVWYLVGLFVVPNTVTTENCVNHKKVVFLKLVNHIKWIRYVTNVRYLGNIKKIDGVEEDVTQRYENHLPQHCGSYTPNDLLEENGQIFNYPWMARLLEYTKNGSGIEVVCVGTVINHRYVLSAGRCLRMNFFFVRLGGVASDIKCIDAIDCGSSGQDYEVEHVIVHVDDFKIGLIRLLNTVHFNDNIQPICLPVSDELKNMDLFEYSVVSHNHSLSWAEMSINVLSNFDCSKNFDGDSTMFCVDAEKDGKFYGGEPLGYPVRIDNGLRFVQLAVNVKNVREIYTVPFKFQTTSPLMDWIMANMKKY
ncbi:uncharacterized protein LOC6050114 [Culex quinquefasciatus]|uniref:uncharacterized protein LOC6050114 n=1 Tax=Culex quinquefasciatus TaxID=7176 RepID=UPI0018E3947F|nr:uncharacterized protein LOC6050114 [Culex quinquefasciatus]